MVAALLVAFLVYEMRKSAKEKQTTQELASAAKTIGFSFKDKTHLPADIKSKRFQLFSESRGLVFRQGSERIRNFMQGNREGIEIRVFEYQYRESGGEYSKTFAQTVVAVKSTTVKFPKFYLRPEATVDKIKSTLGYQDIDFHSYPEFLIGHLSNHDGAVASCLSVILNTTALVLLQHGRWECFALTK